MATEACDIPTAKRRVLPSHRYAFTKTAKAVKERTITCSPQIEAYKARVALPKSPWETCILGVEQEIPESAGDDGIEIGRAHV